MTLRQSVLGMLREMCVHIHNLFSVERYTFVNDIRKELVCRDVTYINDILISFLGNNNLSNHHKCESMV